MSLVRALILLSAWQVLSLGAMPDLVVFDEDDPLGKDYYDASIGSASGGSSLRLLASTRDKIPVTTNSASSGRFSALLEWTSNPGGDWKVHLFSPGFPLLDLAPYLHLQLALNGPRRIASMDLPVIEIRDVSGKTTSHPLGSVLTQGLDADPRTWQTINLPISAFKPSSPNLDFSLVKHVTLRHTNATSTKSAALLWVDDLRFVASDRAVCTEPPPPPARLKGRSGDRSITLHWDAGTFKSDTTTSSAGVQPASEDLFFRGYHVYRSEKENGPFVEIAGSPVQIRSIADTRVENGKACYYFVRAANSKGLSEPSAPTQLTAQPFSSNDAFLDYTQATAFDYFWYEAHPRTGLVRDRSQPWSAASIAATGFGLTAIGIGIDRGWITRDEGRERVHRTLRTLWETPQGAALARTSGHRGWFYHFLQMENGLRFGTSELSSIDTALLLAGVLYVREYFDREHAVEAELRRLAKAIFDRVDWKWMLNDADTLSMGWHPERGFLGARWKGYNEASILYILGLGASEATALDSKHWREWTRTYQWQTHHGFSFIPFAPLFGHQYSACWIDFRNIADDFTRAKGLTYFENSRRATLAQRAYCMQNPGRFPGYHENVWGLTACDGPGSGGTHAYIARGAPPAENDDGTIAPTAAGGSLPFAPEECIAALRTMYDRYRERIWCGYGFRDAFNLAENWWGDDVLGIDQGPILIMAENLRTGQVWEVMRRGEVLNRGLKRAGFQPFSAETPPSFKKLQSP